MKLRFILSAVLLAMVAINANANDKGKPTDNDTSVGIGIGIGTGVGTGGAGGAGGAGGDIKVEAADYGDLKIPPQAIAPNVTLSVICPMVIQGSKAVSVWPFSASGTHEPDLVPICIAWHLGQKDVVELMLCDANKEYRKANSAGCPAHPDDVE